jgi:fatty acid desaturase
MRPNIPHSDFVKFSKVSKWISIATLVGIWCGILTAVILAEKFNTPYVISFLLISAFQVHLLMMLHDGAHFLIHPNKKFNNLLTDVFCGLPLGVYVKFYRFMHLPHHQFTGVTEKDPEIQLYGTQGFDYRRKNARATAFQFFCDFSGINVIRYLVTFNIFVAKQIQKRTSNRLSGSELLTGVLLYGTVAAGCVVFNGWSVLFWYWVLPLGTMTFGLLKLHGYGEHTGAFGPGETERTWVHEYGFLAKFFIYPLNTHLHLEHHLYAGIPWYRLAELRAYLLKNEEFKKSQLAVVSDGYFFGKKSIFRTMIYGSGSYAEDQNWIRHDSAQATGSPIETLDSKPSAVKVTSDSSGLHRSASPRTTIVEAPYEK